MYYNTSDLKPNSTNINPAKRTTFGTVLLSKKVKRTNMLSIQELKKTERIKVYDIICTVHYQELTKQEIYL